MNFLVDAQLPQLLAMRLQEVGHTALHTLDLPDGNRTDDQYIAHYADQNRAVVITKDSDFLDTHLIHGSPKKLLLISTGNISNKILLRLLMTNIQQILIALEETNLVELTHAELVVHS